MKSRESKIEKRGHKNTLVFDNLSTINLFFRCLTSLVFFFWVMSSIFFLFFLPSLSNENIKQ